MERDELLGAIARETERVERAKTPYEKERHQTRLDELRAQLRKMDEPPPKVEDPRAAEAIAAIRQLLYGGAKNGANERTDADSGV